MIQFLSSEKINVRY